MSTKNNATQASKPGPILGSTDVLLSVLALLHAAHDLNEMGSALPDSDLTLHDSRLGALIILARDKCVEAIHLAEQERKLGRVAA